MWSICTQRPSVMVSSFTCFTSAGLPLAMSLAAASASSVAATNSGVRISNRQHHWSIGIAAGLPSKKYCASSRPTV
jgi:hypothetical protein